MHSIISVFLCQLYIYIYVSEYNTSALFSMKNDNENNKKQQKNKYNKLNRRKNVVLHT